VDLVAQRGLVRVSELSDLFHVSEVTIRDDLDLLTRRGILVRERGGAIANTNTTLATAFEQRASLNIEEKRRIGRAAAQLVNPGETIIMDAGTTIMEMAKALTNVSPLTVVTNALNVAIQVGAFSDVHVILVGGVISRETISTVGHHAERDLSDLVAQKVFLGAHTVELEAGVTSPSIEVAQVKRAMIRAGRQVILLADSSKWGRVTFAKVAPLSAIHTIVTDTNLPSDMRTAIERLGIQLILA
jgi:DeoR/GlpR family transcriptional regulator of sugar metabolism